MAASSPPEPEASDPNAALYSVFTDEDFQHSPRFVEARDASLAAAPPSFLVHHLHTPLAASLARRQATDQNSKKKMAKRRGDAASGAPRATAAGGHAKPSGVAASAVPSLSRSSTRTKIASPSSADSNSTHSSRSTASCLAPRKMPSAGGDCRTNVKVVVRCRPMTAVEQRESTNVVDVCTERNEVIVRLRGGGGAGASGKNQSLGGSAAASANAARPQGNAAGSNSSKVFRFDGVCPVSTSQEQFFEQHAQPLVDEVLQGFNCTIFAYGQTGTGKTFTIEGAPRGGGESIYSANDEISENADCGLVGRSVQRIFSTLRGEHVAKDYTVTCSFLEIYNEELIDLFAPAPASAGGSSCPSTQPSAACSDSNDSQASQSGALSTPRLRIYEDHVSSTTLDAAGAGGSVSMAARGPQQTRGVVRVEGLEEKEVKSEREVLALLRAAAPRRSFAASSANAHSSRSHTIFSISVCIRDTANALSDEGGDREGAKSRKGGDPAFRGSTVSAPVEEEVVRVGKLNLVDLAGSENIYKSWGATAEEKRRREALTINKSLLTLGRCINALVDRASYVPYRDSKLTRLLQDSLGGCTKTCLIATISPAENVVEETINTLDYAYRAKSIQNLPVKTLRHSKSLLLSSLLQENQQLKLLLCSQRERDGVFLPLPLFTQREQQLQSQHEQLTHQEAQIRRLEDRILAQQAALKAFEETKDELNAAREARDCLQQRVERLESALDASRASTRSLEAELQRREAQEAFLLSQMTCELQKQHSAAAAARATLTEAVEELGALASHQKAALLRARACGRETACGFARVVDAACTDLGREQSLQHNRLEAALKTLSAQEDARAAAADETANILRRLAHAQQKREFDDQNWRMHALDAWRRQAEAHQVATTKEVDGIADALQRIQGDSESLLKVSGRRTRETLEALQSQLKQEAESAVTVLAQKAGEEAKQREQIQLATATLVKKETLHTRSTAEAIERLSLDLGTWKETQEKHLTDAASLLVAAVERHMQQFTTHQQECLERHIQSLQTQLKMLQEEQMSQGKAVQTIGAELAAASEEGAAAVSALATAAQTGFDSLLGAFTESAENRRKEVETQEASAVAAFHAHAKGTQTQLNALKDCISEHHQSFCLSVAEASEREKRSSAARAEAAEKTSEVHREREAEKSRLRRVAKTLLEDISEIAHNAETHRREALTKQQQRAGEFVKSIRRELPGPCAGKCTLSVDPLVVLEGPDDPRQKPPACISCAAEAAVEKWSKKQMLEAAASSENVTENIGQLSDLLRRRFHELEQGKASESQAVSATSSVLATETTRVSSPLSPLTTGCSDSDIGASSPDLASGFTENNSEQRFPNLTASAASDAHCSLPVSSPPLDCPSGACSLSAWFPPADAAGASPGEDKMCGMNEAGERVSEEAEKVSGGGSFTPGEASAEELEEATEDEAQKVSSTQWPAPAACEKGEAPASKPRSGKPSGKPIDPQKLGKGAQRLAAAAPGVALVRACRPNAENKKSSDYSRRAPTVHKDVDVAGARAVSRRHPERLSPIKNSMKGPGAAASQSGNRPGKAVVQLQSVVEVSEDVSTETENAARGGSGKEEKRARSVGGDSGETEKSKGKAEQVDDEQRRHGLRRGRSSDGLFVGLESDKKKLNTDGASPAAARFATSAPCGIEGARGISME
ncbi:kinesin motor domain-containing protein [Toxoplasma gondii CAST]|uniref:Kinesin motor domain-containing protein n=1 Tax=Toxoplasma gondii CAST TaxID=943122 RepID=A0A425HNC9_TOXGO|nr:kinesin motor domain-containing protein [Toxoplasma gondii CAST]